MKESAVTLRFHVDGAGAREIAISEAIIAGWTGRDSASVEKHIRELEELGVRRPASTPIFYRVAASRLTTKGAIEASGGASSGEVEFVLVRDNGKLWVGVGSDHTDREVEAYSVTVSKQMCEKPVAPELWPFDKVKGHWDRLQLRSWIIEKNERVAYQDGLVTSMRTPEDLMARYAEGLTDGSLMFCGTLAAIGGVRPAPRFEFELHDPVLKRSIRHGYDILTLPILG